MFAIPIRRCLQIMRWMYADAVCDSSQLARSFDVHLLKSGQWECVGYHGTSQDPGYFNVPNDNVLAAYGYAL